MLRSLPSLVLALLLFPGAGLAGPASAPNEPLLSSADANLLRAVGRDLSLALERPAVRAWLHDSIASSPYVEGRIALDRELRLDPGLRDRLVPTVARRHEPTRLLERLPSLELYFPIDEHRASWTPESEVWLAVRVADESYVLFEGGRGYREIGPDEVPPVPTLVLGPSEIDFDDFDSALVGGRLTGEYLASRELEDGSSGPAAGELATLFAPSGTGGTDPSRHTYLTYLKVTHDHDGLDGDMEIEVYGSINGGYGTCTRITNVNKNTPLSFPPPSAPGSRKIAYAVPGGSGTVHVDVWEDDDTGCVLKGSDDHVGQTWVRLDQYGQVWGTTDPGNAEIKVDTVASLCGDSLCEGDETIGNCCTDCATCGDRVCHSCETVSSCPGDCDQCGNGVCDWGETEANCPVDCGCPSGGYCNDDADCGAYGSCFGNSCMCPE